MSLRMPKRAFTVEEYDQMVATGILTEDDRLELIEGEIIEMAAVGKRRASCVNLLAESLTEQSNRRFIVSAQNPIQISDLSEPEPDIALLIRREDFYRRQTPRAEDVLLVVEVSDSSLEHDRRTKLPAYALAGIPEFWLVNLVEERIEIYTQPAEGKYTQVVHITSGDKLISATIPDLALDADALLA